MFEHARMKKISAATIKSAGGEADDGASNSIELIRRTELNNVAQSFIILQQARHDADYNLDRPLDPADAVAQLDQALSAFVSWGPTPPGNTCFHCYLTRRNERKAVPFPESPLLGSFGSPANLK